jgi:acyl CoA:acetate/3-ketoacid CoA transferase alpha subunit
VSDGVAAVPDGATLMIGGFVGVGTPRRLIDELVRQGERGLKVIATDTARPGVGIGKLISARLARRLGDSADLVDNPSDVAAQPRGIADFRERPSPKAMSRRSI